MMVGSAVDTTVPSMAAIIWASISVRMMTSTCWRLGRLPPSEEALSLIEIDLSKLFIWDIVTGAIRASNFWY